MFKRILGMAVAVALGLTVNAAMAQGGYGALSYFGWSVDDSGSSLEGIGPGASGRRQHIRGQFASRRRLRPPSPSGPRAVSRARISSSRVSAGSITRST